ncbi:hypothetical protein BKA62DRAFT_718759 [Auriculariales sp. MPI-PUGE-AT-0066]|nr:hypothetical protein BKA62DRAFT_718759 [Auriculariales sp. MPI-PUGE-AT-0066]
MSLHSNIGGARDRSTGRRKKKAKAGRSVSLWGFSLFGRPRGVIALPDSDDEESSALANGEEGRRQRRRTRSSASASSAGGISDTADPDPPTVTDTTIANLSRSPPLQLNAALSQWEPQATLDDLAAEEAAQREQEERRAAKRMRKDMKRAAAALAAGVSEEGDFEGFPGSGSYAPNSMPDFRGQLSPTAASQDHSEFGAFVHSDVRSNSSSQRSAQQQQKQPPVEEAGKEAADLEEADFDSATYARRGSTSNGQQRTGSDTRSSSSGGRRNHRSARSITSGSSVLAPPTPPPAHGAASPHAIPLPRSPLSQHDFEQEQEDELARSFAQQHTLERGTPSPRPVTSAGASAGFPSTGFSRESVSGFPSRGFSRPKAGDRKLSAASFRDALSS